jgi:hypothetical protein
MAWIEQHRRADGGLTARVIWRPGGARDATRVWETFGAGSDAQNLARANGFKRMVEAAGQRWPDGWVKGEGFVRPPDVADPENAARAVLNGQANAVPKNADGTVEMIRLVKVGQPLRSGPAPGR